MAATTATSSTEPSRSSPRLDTVFDIRRFDADLYDPAEVLEEAMRALHEVMGAALAAALPAFATVLPAGGFPGPVAIDGSYAINGTYTAVSGGQWSRTNEKFQQEATVTSTWTFTST